MLRRFLVVASVVAALLPLVAAQPAGASTLPPGFADSTVTGLTKPSDMAIAPDGRIFVTEQDGPVRIVENGALRAEPFATLPVAEVTDQGVLAITFPPDYPTSHRVYVLYVAAAPVAHTEVAWFGGADGPTATSGPHVILSLPAAQSSIHAGGLLEFGADGQLYVGIGDDEQPTEAQNLDAPLGKVVRITPDGDASVGNPTFGGAPHDPRVWAYGLRNPFRGAFDSHDGALFINDVGSTTDGACGSGTWEEVNLGAAGANYGWPLVEGPASTAACTKPGLTYPLSSYSHADSDGGCAVTGGTFYRPGDRAALSHIFDGAYFFTDLCGGWIKYRTSAGDVVKLVGGLNGPVAVETGPDGALYYLADFAGELGRITLPDVFLRDTPTSGGADEVFAAGRLGTQELFCDWDGNGTDTIGFHVGNQWYLRNQNDASGPETAFIFGDPTDVPVCGDWDGTGGASIGVRRGDTFWLRNTNSAGFADTVVQYGDGSDVPIVGDWNGDGIDTVGVHRDRAFFLRDTNTSGFADVAFEFGDARDAAIVGDWDGNGSDTVAVHRDNVFYFNDQNHTGYAASTAVYGNAGDLGVAGSWNATAGDGIGVTR